MSKRLIFINAAALCLTVFASNAQAQLEAGDAAVAEKPIARIEEGRKDKTFKVGEPVFIYIKFNRAIRDGLSGNSMKVYATGLVDDKTEFQTDDKFFDLSDAELDKSDLCVPLFPVEYDLSVQWIKNTYNALNKAIVLKKKLECKVKIYYDTKDQSRYREYAVPFFLDGSQGGTLKWKGAFVMNKPGQMNTPQFQKEVAALYQPKEGKIVRVQITSDDWEVKRNEMTGAILRRGIWAEIFVRNDATNTCDIRRRLFYQEFQGGNNYGKLYLSNDGIYDVPVPCEKFDEWFKGASQSDAKTAKGKK